MQTTAFPRPAVLLPALKYPLRRTSATGVRVATAFHAAVDGRGRNPLSELRAATVAFAALMRAEGLPPEKTLVALKTALRTGEHSLSLARTSFAEQATPTTEYTMYARVFAWYLEGYFGTMREPVR